MSKKNIKINHTAVSNSINKYRILMIVFITAAMCVMSAGIGTAEDVNLTLEGHFGGATDAVVVSCDCVYVEQAGDAARLLHRRGVFEPKTRG